MKYLFLLLIPVLFSACSKEDIKPERHIVYKVGDGNTPVTFVSSVSDIYDIYDTNAGGDKIFAVTELNDPGSGAVKNLGETYQDGEYWYKVKEGSGYANIRIIDSREIRLQVLLNDKVIYDEVKKDNSFSRDLTPADWE